MTRCRDIFDAAERIAVCFAASTSASVKVNGNTGNRVTIVSGITANAALQIIAAKATFKHIITRIADQHICAIAADKLIISKATIQLVGPTSPIKLSL